MIKLRCPYCNVLHDVAVIFKPTTEKYKEYNVLYRKKLYHCQVRNKLFQDNHLKNFNNLQKKTIIDNYNK